MLDEGHRQHLNLPSLRLSHHRPFPHPHRLRQWESAGAHHLHLNQPHLGSREMACQHIRMMMQQWALNIMVHAQRWLMQLCKQPPRSSRWCLVLYAESGKVARPSLSKTGSIVSLRFPWNTWVLQLHRGYQGVQ